MQSLHPLYGELITDLSVAKSLPGGPGLYESSWPRISGSNAIIDPSPRGRVAWRANGGPNGDLMIFEDAAISVPLLTNPGPASGNPNLRVDLLVGIYEWVAGPTNWASGIPLGVLTTQQQATYAMVQGVAVASSVGVKPVPPDIPFPYSGNKYAVPLARINWSAATVIIETFDPNDYRAERRAGQVAYMEYAYVTPNWNIVTFSAHPDVGYKLNATQLSVLRTGYYMISAAVANPLADVTIQGISASNFTAKASITTSAFLSQGATLSFTSSDTASTVLVSVTFLGWNLGTPIVGQLQTFSIAVTDFDVSGISGTRSATALPFAALQRIGEVGGRDPVAWAITATTIPGAAVSGTSNNAGLTGNISTHGTWTVTLQATDALGRVQTKTTNWTMPAMVGNTSTRLLGNPPVTWPYVTDQDLDQAWSVSFNLGVITLSGATITRAFDLAFTPTWKVGSDQVAVDLIGPTRVRLTIPMEYPCTYVDGGGVTRNGGYWKVTATATDLSGATATVTWKIGFNQV